jgi:1-acyl-sn-glycerol-3-phosphate acyltransferase
MKWLISGIVLSLVHFFSRVFYRVDVTWVNPSKEDPWKSLAKDELRVIVFLNHTSLFEPLLLGGVPYHFLWMMAGKLLVPGADKTLKRPLVGTFYKLLTPATIPISRKRDGTWESFMSLISKDTIVMLAPEGRMKRKNGLDSKGQPMSVRGGVSDILNSIQQGKMLLCYSGGLHHIQAPGERFPRVFQSAQVCYEVVDIAQYRKQLSLRPEPFKMAVVRDLEARMKRHVPT